MTPSEGRVRVRHVPAGHAYVEHLLPARPGRPGGPGGVEHLRDPRIPGAPPGQWWPHPALEAGWVRRHRSEQDLIHVHFGTEGATVEELDRWLRTLSDVGLPLVHTVHDIDHPHLRDQSHHRRHLAALVEHSDGLITLTQGAAGRIERTFGRRPLVVPHPHVVPLARLDQPRQESETFTVGLHLKSLRTNVAPMTVLPMLLRHLPSLGERIGRPAVLEIRGHDDLLEPTAPRHDPELAELLVRLSAAPPPGVRVVLGPRLSDAQLWDYLGGLDVSVLPYAWATHSGWVEACRDLGTWVLAPDVGHLVEQGGVLAWGPADRAPSGTRLLRLLQHAAAAPADRPGRAARTAQRAEIAAAHADLYRRVLAGERVDAGRMGE